MSQPEPSGTAARPVVTFNEYGHPLCPLEATEMAWDEDGNERTYRSVPCLAEMYLTVRLSISPGRGDPVVTRDGFVNDNANTSSWEFGCINGHVLATSCEEENAEDFTWLAGHMGGQE